MVHGELQIGTDPNQADTDLDGLTDGEEVLFYATDPRDADTDDGGVVDGEELTLGTDPLDPDDDASATTGAFNGGCQDGCSAIGTPRWSWIAALRRR